MMPIGRMIKDWLKRKWFMKDYQTANATQELLVFTSYFFSRLLFTLDKVTVGMSPRSCLTFLGSKHGPCFHLVTWCPIIQSVTAFSKAPSDFYKMDSFPAT